MKNIMSSSSSKLIVNNMIYMYNLNHFKLLPVWS